MVENERRMKMHLDVSVTVEVPEELVKVVVKLPDGTSREWRATRAILEEGKNDLAEVRFINMTPQSRYGIDHGRCYFEDKDKQHPTFELMNTIVNFTEEERSALVQHFLKMREALKVVKVVVSVHEGKGQQPA